MKHGLASSVFTWGPLRAAMSLGTGGGLVVPVELKLADSKSLIGFCLPTMVFSNWTNDVNTVLRFAVNVGVQPRGSRNPSDVLAAVAPLWQGPDEWVQPLHHQRLWTMLYERG